MLAKWGFIEISQCNHIIIHLTVCLLCRLICPDADDSAALCKNELEISPDLRWQITQLIGDLLTVIIGLGFGVRTLTDATSGSASKASKMRRASVS